MKLTAILNGCSDNFISQAQEINSFLLGNISFSIEANCIILFNDDEKRADLIRNSPTTNVMLIKVKRYQPESILSILDKVETDSVTDMYLFSSDYAGQELSVRFSYRKNGSSLVNVKKIELEKENILFKKSVYSNHMEGNFKLNKKPFCISIAKGCTDNNIEFHMGNRSVFELDMSGDLSCDFVKDYELEKEEIITGLDKAKFILAAGRGVRNKENIEKLKVIAKELGAEFGSSRPVTMSAWAPMQDLIGVSGAMTKPQLCITAGVSGAAAFFAGIEKSGFIISINNDERAPIIKNSDVAIIDDYEKILDALVEIVGDSPTV